MAGARDQVEQLLLGAVVDVERGRAHPGGGGDVAGGGAVEPLRRERLHGGGEQPGARSAGRLLGSAGGCDLGHALPRAPRG